MKKITKHIIAYSADNQSTANEIQHVLSPAGYEFEHMACGNDIEYQNLGERLLESDLPTLLLISDNFLKSPGCMKGGLDYLQKLTGQNKILPLVIDGTEENDDGTIGTVPTAFDRVSHIIKYMNYWQEKYLELRKQKRGIKPEKEVEFNHKLNVVRSISSTIGEFLRYLRSSKHYTFEQFQNNHFEAFFQFANDKEGYEQFASEKTQDSTHFEVEEANEEEADNKLTNQPEYIQNNEEHLVDLIHESSEDILKENEDLKEQINEQEIVELDVPEIDIASIPGIELLNGNEEEAEHKKIVETTEAEYADTEVTMIKKEAGEDAVEVETVLEVEDKELENTQVNEKQEEVGYETQLENLSEIEIVEPENGVDSILESVLKEGEESGENPTEDIEEQSLAELEKILEEEESLEISDTPSTEQTNQDSDLIEEDNEGMTIEELLEDSVVKIEQEEGTEVIQFIQEKDNSESTFEDEQIEVPLNFEEVLEKSTILFQQGNKEEGLQLIRNSLNNNPTNTTIRYQYAYSLGKYGNDFKGAIEELETLLSFDPKHEDAYFLLAELAELHKDHLLAKNYYEKVEALNPKYPNIAYRLGMLYLNHFQDNQKEASVYFKKALRINKKNADAHYRLAIILNEHFGKHWKAVKHFKKTLKIRPEHPFANYDLAMIYHRLGDRPLAFDYYQRAIEVNPELQTPRNDEAFRYALLDGNDDANLPHIFDTEEDPEFLELKKDMARLEAKMAELNKPYDPEGFGKAEIQEPDFEALLEKKMNIDDLQEVSSPLIPATSEAASEEESVVPMEEEAPREIEAGPIVLITGATAGIGKATAELFAKEGYRVIMTGRRAERLSEIKEYLAVTYNATITTLTFDIKDLEAGEEALNSLPEEWKNVDVLINNAGMGKGYAPIHEGKIEDWNEMIDTNIRGLLFLTRAISSEMVKRKSGHIINVASTSGKYVSPNNAVYSATKFAVEGLTKSMRVDLFKHNIRVSQVSPAMVKTEFAIVRLDGDESGAAQYYKGFQALKPEDVAETIFFIASRPAHVNIQDIEMWSTQQLSPTVFNKLEEEE